MNEKPSMVDIKYPSETRKLFDDVLLNQTGLSYQELKALPSGARTMVIDKIRSISSSPKVNKILQEKRGKPLTAEDTKAIRELVGVEKWQDLS